MSTMKDDLSHRFFLDVCANGSIHIRERGAPGGFSAGLLPVFSTDTRKEAELLQVRHCRLARDGSGLYFLNEPPKDVEDLGRVSDLFRATFDRRAARSLRDPRVRRAALNIIDRIAR